MRVSWTIVVAGLLLSGTAQAEDHFGDSRIAAESAIQAGYRLSFGGTAAPVHSLSAGFRLRDESRLWESEAIRLDFTRGQPKQLYLSGVAYDVLQQWSRGNAEEPGAHDWVYPTVLLGGVFAISAVIVMNRDENR